MSTKASELAQYGVNIDADRFLKIPSVTTAERDTISAVPGMLIYNSSVGVLQQYTGNNVWSSITAGPTVISVILPNSQTAAFGGDSIIINGTGFDLNASVKFIDSLNNQFTATSTTYINAIKLTAVLPSLTEGTYDILVTNGTGEITILSNAFDIDGTPVFNNSSGSLGSVTDKTGSANFDAGAVEDGSPATISITSGALPNGLSINSQGLITGTPNTDDFADTQYNFTVTATDSENQTSSRNFSITVIANYTITGSLAFNGPKE